MRYSRQVIFERIGPTGQEKLNKSKITIIGLGAIGTRSAELLTRAGVGSLILIDRDIIELTNLQRQTLFTEKDIGKSKAEAAKERLQEINSTIKIKSYLKDLDFNNIEDLIKGSLILDCTDNIETRFLINEFSIEKNIPWIYSAVVGNIGMTYNIIPKKTPCFRCIFNEPTEPLSTCDTEGILNTISSLISSIQVTEAIKILTKQPVNKELVYYDIWKNKLTKQKVKKNPNCKACNKRYEYLNGKKAQTLIKLCGTNKYQLKGPKLDLNNVYEKLKNIDKNIILNEFCLIFKNMTLFKDGRAVIKAESPEEAKSFYSKYIGN